MKDESRNINVKISDQERKKLEDLCKSKGITVSGLLERFIADLTGGHGDESDLASQWFYRHIW